MLKFKLNTADFDALNELEKSFYAMAGDGYQLQVDGATDKSKVDEFRASNVELLKREEAYKGVDLVKFREYEDRDRKILEGDLIEKKDFEGLIASRTDVLSSDFQAKIDNANTRAEDAESRASSMQSKYEIEGAANKAFNQHKIHPDTYEAVMGLVKGKFSIDGGKVIARDGDNILLGADGNLTVSEFVASQPEAFKIQSQGGAGKGSAPVSQNNDASDAKRAAYAKMMGV